MSCKGGHGISPTCPPPGPDIIWILLIITSPSYSSASGLHGLGPDDHSPAQSSSESSRTARFTWSASSPSGQSPSTRWSWSVAARHCRSPTPGVTDSSPPTERASHALISHLISGHARCQLKMPASRVEKSEPLRSGSRSANRLPPSPSRAESWTALSACCRTTSA